MPPPRPLRAFGALFCALVMYISFLSVCCRANFLPRDFVESSLRIQTSTGIQSKANPSEWVQLEGANAPVFGAHKHALVSIPRETESMQMAFDHQRLVTEWLKLSGSVLRRVKNPVVLVTLTRTGSALTGVHAAVHSYQTNTGMAGGVKIHEGPRFMAKLFQEFYAEGSEAGATKRVLVKYSWKTRHDTDVATALMVLMGLGVVTTGLMGLKTYLAYQDELKRFYSDFSSSEPSDSGYIRQPPQQRLHQQPLPPQRRDGGWAQSGGGYIRQQQQQRAAVGLWQQQGHGGGGKAD